jgi:hypothetical protein
LGIKNHGKEIESSKRPAPRGPPRASTMQSITIDIATRRYFDRCPRTGQEYRLTDRLVRKGRRLFLIEVPEPGGREVVKPISLGYAFQWLSELPEEIERAVIVGGLAA